MELPSFLRPFATTAGKRLLHILQEIDQMQRAHMKAEPVGSHVPQFSAAKLVPFFKPTARAPFDQVNWTY